MVCGDEEEEKVAVPLLLSSSGDRLDRMARPGDIFSFSFSVSFLLSGWVREESSSPLL